MNALYTDQTYTDKLFNPTIHDISVILWQSILFVKDNGILEYSEKTTDLSHVTDQLYHTTSINIIIKAKKIYLWKI